jgi:hypothetical protein
MTRRILILSRLPLHWAQQRLLLASPCLPESHTLRTVRPPSTAMMPGQTGQHTPRPPLSTTVSVMLVSTEAVQMAKSLNSKLRQRADEEIPKGRSNLIMLSTTSIKLRLEPQHVLLMHRLVLQTSQRYTRISWRFSKPISASRARSKRSIRKLRGFSKEHKTC